MVGIFHETVAGQLVGQKSGLPAAHGVRLAGERKGAGAGLADLAGQQVEVDQTVVFPHSDRALIQSHAVKAEEAAGSGDPVSDLIEHGLGYSRDGTKFPRVLVQKKLSILLKASAVIRDKGLVNGAVRH